MSSTTDSKPTILLLPGAWHPTACLDALRAELHKASYTTVSEQLACLSPSDPVAHSVSTDATYIRESLLLPLLNDGKRVVMVMHSYAGNPGSGAAYGLSVEEREEAGLKGGVVGLIYMAAFMVPSGQSNADTEPPPLIGMSFDGKGVCTVTPSGAIQNFYNELPATTAQFWSERLLPLPVHCFTTSLTHTAHEQPAYRDNKRLAYIQCTKDKAVPIDMQQRWSERAGIEGDKVVVLEMDHSPFLADAAMVAGVIGRLVEGFK